MRDDRPQDAPRSQSRPGRLLGRALTLSGWVLTAACLAAVVAFMQYEAGDGPGPTAGPSGPPPGEVAEEEEDSTIWSLAFSPDGRRLASATVGGAVRVRDLATGRSFAVQSGPTSSARALAYSPDGRTLAVAGANAVVRLWDLDEGAEADTPALCGCSIDCATKCVAYSPDGRRLAVGLACGRVSLCDPDGRRPPEILQARGDCVNLLAFAPDGSALAAGDTTGRAQLWDLPTGRRREFRAHQSSLRGLAFSPDGRRLLTVGSLDPTVRVWDPAAGAPLGALPPGRSAGNALSISTGGAVAVARMDGSVSLLDRDPGSVRGTFRSGRALYAVAFSPDGRTVATGGSDAVLRLWDAGHFPAPAVPLALASSPRLAAPAAH